MLRRGINLPTACVLPSPLIFKVTGVLPKLLENKINKFMDITIMIPNTFTHVAWGSVIGCIHRTNSPQGFTTNGAVKCKRNASIYNHG